MNSNVKIAIIIAVTAIIITGMKIYFSPFYACTRAMPDDIGVCARITSGNFPLPFN